MAQSRRSFIAGSAAAAAVGATSIGHAATASFRSGSSYSKVAAEIVGLFDPLPGTSAVKIFAPATHNRREFVAELNTALPLFIGSAFKGYVLCEALRRVDSSYPDSKLEATQLKLDKSVWSLDSTVFNPPYLCGLVSERTALEAMISHSDNTGADMTLKHIGADSVRNFIAGIGLRHTQIPNSTRQFLGYIFGAPNWQTISYDEVVAISKGTPVHPSINDVQTMVSSADDFVSFYSRALQGEFFNNAATLTDVSIDPDDRGCDSGRGSARRDRLRQGRRDQRRQLPCPLPRGRNVLRRAMGLFRHDDQLAERQARTRQRSSHSKWPPRRPSRSSRRR